ncbi:MAG: flagellar biosynthetic protein FliO, partial [bacterium]
FYLTAVALAVDEGMSTAPNLWWSTIKTLAVLLFVLALVFLAAWAVKRFSPLVPGAYRGTERIQILSSKSLGTRRAVHLLEVEGKRILIGSSEAGITLIENLGDAEKVND